MVTIGLLIEIEGTVDIEGYKTLLRTGVADALREEHVNLICFAGGSLQRSPYAMEEKKRNLLYQMIDKKYLDGLIVVPTIGAWISPRRFQGFLRQFHDLPIVAAGYPLDGYPSAATDNRSGIQALCEHLFEVHGYRNPVFITGPRNYQDGEIRLSEYQAALSGYGVLNTPERILKGSFTIESGQEAVRELLTCGTTKFDVIVCANDHMAVGAINALIEKGKRIPEDVAVTGFDDDIKASFALPPLTTVRQPIYDIGREAARMLLQWIRDGKKPDDRELPTQLIVRQSCGCGSDRLPDAGAYHHEARGSAAFSAQKLRISTIKRISQRLKKPEETVRTLFDALVPAQGSPNPRLFLDSIKCLFHDPQFDVRLYDQWQDIFSQISGIFLLIGRKENADLSASLLDKARVIILEYERNYFSLTKLRADMRLEALHHLGRLLYAQFDLAGICKVIKEELPGMGVDSVLAALYDPTAEAMSAPKDFLNLPRKCRPFCVFNSKTSTRRDFRKNLATAKVIPIFLALSQDAKHYVIEPLFYKDRSLGFLVLEMGPREGFFYETLRSQLSGALFDVILFRELRQKNRMLTDLASRDSLTGLYNHITIQKRLCEILEEAQRNRFPLAFLMIDVDDFKKINDTFGHSTGDHVLHTISDCLLDELEIDDEPVEEENVPAQRIIRQYDVAGRYGGDEFCVILPYCGRNEALTVAERIFRQITEEPREMLRQGYISLSIGVAVLEKDIPCPHARELVQLADHALYQSKRLGKNRIEIYSYPHALPVH